MPVFGRKTEVAARASASRAASMTFIADQIRGAVDQQLSTADALDVKIGGLFALAVATLLGYVAALASMGTSPDVASAVGTGLAFGYAFGCAFEALLGLRVAVYERWPNPEEYVRLTKAPVSYELGDLGEQAAIEMAQAHASNKAELLWKSARLRWSLVFVTAQLGATMFALLRAYTLK